MVVCSGRTALVSLPIDFVELGKADARLGLYGLLRFHEITNDPYALHVALKWFEDRFAVGTTKNVNTMSPLLTAAYLHESKLANYKVRRGFPSD